MDVKRMLTMLLVCVWLAASAAANAVVLTHTVDGMDNLYNTSWAGNPHPSAIGTGLDARSVASGGSPFDFSSFSSVAVIASGLVVDAGATATSADGTGGVFRGLPVYSMIGLWSSTGSAITALGTPFFVGTSATLAVPSAASAFLFLAENDGLFADNSGSYSVRLTTDGAAEVDVPATLGVLIAGSLVMLRRPRRVARA